MLEARFRPIETWPGKPTPPYARCRPFKASYGDTLDALEKELRHLRAKNITIEAYFTLQQIRNDGWPYSNARPTQPGVVLSFDSTHGTMRIHCDDCDTWEHNLRAIAMHLNHLRMSGIYGVGKDGQQYRGWKQLPPGSQAVASPVAMTVEVAARFVASVVAPGVHGVADNIAASPDTARSCYRQAAKHLHPDANGGNAPADWGKLQQAWEVLERHHGTH